jgi:hypothetical protein
MTHTDPFELIDSPFAEGKTERWRVEAMAVGVIGALKDVCAVVRADAEAAAERNTPMENTMAKMVKLCDGLEALHKRFDAYMAKQEAIELQHKLDQAKQQELATRASGRHTGTNRSLPGCRTSLSRSHTDIENCRAET